MNLDCMLYGIKNIRILDINSDVEFPKYTNSMICYFNATDVRAIFSKHDLPYGDPDCAVIEFYDGRVYEVDLHPQDKMRNVEKLISHIFKMKMMGTKWEKEHPEQYI